jgi:hypothetical protein
LTERDTKTEDLKPILTKHPEVIDDFIRNYLSNKSLHKSLEAFQVLITNVTE